MENTNEGIFFRSRKYLLRGYISYPKNYEHLPGVLFIHGGGRYTENIYESWQKYLSSNGFASFFVYCRGVGESEGKFEDGSIVNRLEDSVAAYNKFIQSGIMDPEKVVIYGSSMGAHVAVRFIEQFPEIKTLILQSAAAYSEKAERLPLNGKFSEEIKSDSSYKLSPVFPILKKYQGYTFVVHGENDEVIPHEVMDLYRKSINKGEYYVIKNGNHKLLRPKNPDDQKARDELYNKTVEFINKYQ